MDVVRAIHRNTYMALFPRKCLVRIIDFPMIAILEVSYDMLWHFAR